MRVEGSKMIRPKKKAVVTSSLNERTSQRIASLAAKTLANKKADKFAKSIAASALTQAPDQPYKSQRCWVLLGLGDKALDVLLFDKPRSGALGNWVRGKLIFKKSKKARR